MADHAALRALVERHCADAQDLPTFADLLRNHVRWEERELFPAIERLVSADVLAQLAVHLADRDAGRSDT